MFIFNPRRGPYRCRPPSAAATAKQGPLSVYTTEQKSVCERKIEKNARAKPLVGVGEVCGGGGARRGGGAGE